MTDTERRSAAARFAADWKGRGDEKQETQAFWLTLLQKIYGIEEPEKYISFELPVKLDRSLPNPNFLHHPGKWSLCRPYS